MNRLATLFSSLVLSVALYSCFPQKSSEASDNPNKDIRRKYYSDGTLHKEMVYKDGKQHGIAKEFFRSGKLFQEVPYENNLREGTARRYYESGKLSQETPYHNDLMHGIQKKYRRSGDLMCEVPYFNGNLCVGLKEYTTDGKLKQKYPSIVITPIDNILLNETYTLQLKMSDGSKGVEFYVGELSKDGYIGTDTQRVWEVINGVAEINFPMPRGAFLMEEINIIAKVKTAQSNYFITQNKFHLAIENR
ncbi:MAG TPA: toxin-antitoxin system YwqK family antitoxin [Ohtaekwangia sp.]|uniref:toxin-antitoxin system YwqK family antitoxin n=1 Tax=Ohtaekwangia sp. TaxID=2066019 RepID=UPI002F95E9CE